MKTLIVEYPYNEILAAKRNEWQIHTTTWMNLKTLCRAKEKKDQKNPHKTPEYTVWTHLYIILEQVKLTSG